MLSISFRLHSIKGGSEVGKCCIVEVVKIVQMVRLKISLYPAAEVEESCWRVLSSVALLHLQSEECHPLL